MLPLICYDKMLIDIINIHGRWQHKATRGTSYGERCAAIRRHDAAFIFMLISLIFADDAFACRHYGDIAMLSMPKICLMMLAV